MTHETIRNAIAILFLRRIGRIRPRTLSQRPAAPTLRGRNDQERDRFKPCIPAPARYAILAQHNHAPERGDTTKTRSRTIPALLSMLLLSAAHAQTDSVSVNGARARAGDPHAINAAGDRILNGRRR
jgi:hypothetical protein